MMTTQQLAQQLGVPDTTLEAWRRLHIGPPAIRVGQRYRYLRLDVQAWAEHGGDLAHGIELAPLRGVADDSALAVLVDDHAQEFGAGRLRQAAGD